MGELVNFNKKKHSTKEKKIRDVKLFEVENVLNNVDYSKFGTAEFDNALRDALEKVIMNLSEDSTTKILKNDNKGKKKK
jgi:hypothetical protein